MLSWIPYVKALADNKTYMISQARVDDTTSTRSGTQSQDNQRNATKFETLTLKFEMNVILLFPLGYANGCGIVREKIVHHDSPIPRPMNQSSLGRHKSADTPSTAEKP